MEVQEISKADEKRQRASDAVHRKRMRTLLWWGGGAAVLIGVVFGIVRALQLSEKNTPGMFFPAIGQEHIQLKDPLPKPYNSNPPSSGAHFPQPANWGVYEYEVNDKLLVHNLEHGGIWISYRPAVSTKVVDDLKIIVNEFSGSKLVMAPRQANDADVAIAAWTRVLKINLVSGALTDEQKNEIRAFYRALKNHGPELVPDTMLGVDPKKVQ